MSNPEIRYMPIEDLVVALKSGQLCVTDAEVRTRCLAIALAICLEDRNPASIATIIDGLREERMFKSFQEQP